MRRLSIILLVLVLGGLVFWLFARPVRNPDIFIGPATTRPLMAAGAEHAVFVAPDGTVWAWGADAPNGWTEPKLPADPRPWKLSDERGWQAIATGYGFTVGLKTNGTLWLWGSPMAAPRITPRTPTVPRQVDEATNWASVAACGQSLFALKTDGTMWTCNINLANQQGAGANFFLHRAGSDEATNWVKVACGSLHAVGLRSDGTLWVWGARDPLDGSGGTPTQIGLETNWADIACAEFLLVARQVNGRCWAWRDKSSAVSNLPLSAVPSPFSTSRWDWAAGGDTHLLLLSRDGQLRAWGDDFQGELGLTTSGRPSKTLNVADPPGLVGGRSDWMAVAATGNMSCGLTSDGQVWAWGARLDRTRVGLSPVGTMRALFSGTTGRGSKLRFRVDSASTSAPEPLFRFVCATNGAARAQHN